LSGLCLFPQPGGYLTSLFIFNHPLAGGKGPKKEGVCPDTVVEAANCTEECQADSDCEENLKCCQTGCGWSCQIPNGNIEGSDYAPLLGTGEATPGVLCPVLVPALQKGCGQIGKSQVEGNKND
uniref:WAP domain-containing protein n=1 Tax=Chelonoidis abingdonii TaxID=106734 RepID=A0A8C0GET3_CHEAB